jgi:hypothetical protein
MEKTFQDLTISDGKSSSTGALKFSPSTQPLVKCRCCRSIGLAFLSLISRKMNFVMWNPTVRRRLKPVLVCKLAKARLQDTLICQASE